MSENLVPRKSVPLEFILEPTNEDYDPSDSRWIRQVNQLTGQLQDSGIGAIRKDVTPVKGRKGGAEAIILALGSAGAITATVELFKAWLGRDRSRNLKIKIKRGDVLEEIEVEGKGMDAGTIRTFMETAVAKAAEGA